MARGILHELQARAGYAGEGEEAFVLWIIYLGCTDTTNLVPAYESEAFGTTVRGNGPLDVFLDLISM